MKSIIALLQFTTILPLGKCVDIEHLARRSYLYPLSGWVIGGIAAAAVVLIPHSFVAAGVAIALVLLLSGCNHFDGLLDFGDGLMVHGDPERRRAAMTDHRTGTGALACGITVTLLLYAALQSSVYPVFAAVLTGEVCAKLAMSYLTTTGPPSREGTHSFFHRYARPSFLVYATILTIPLVAILRSPVALALCLATTALTALCMRGIALRLFGGVSGDVVGAANEITRAAVVLALALFLPAL